MNRRRKVWKSEPQALHTHNNNYLLAKSISVIFPCYNEQDNVREITREALEIFSKITADFEIIIVNDGSRDKTRENAEELLKKNKNVLLGSVDIWA